MAIQGWRVRWCSYRRTRHGWHLRIAFSIVSPAPGERPEMLMLRIIGAQLALGDDRWRGLYNLRRAAGWHRLSPFWRRRINVLYKEHWPLCEHS